MTENKSLCTELESWLENNETQSGLVLSSDNLISEEKKPIFFSVEDSICSETVDLSAQDVETLYPTNDHYSTSKNLEPSFFTKKHSKYYFPSNEISKLDSFIAGNVSINNKFRKCNSLQDVSNITPLEITAKSMNGISCETIHSQSLSSTTKSKDSGIQRSLSCISLTSGKPNFDHIESKVKAYIRNIKESEALRKKRKEFQNIKGANIVTPKVIFDQDIIVNKEDLLLKIQELQLELQEKALYIDAQQKNYNSLLLKLAEAKNTIDRLRLQGMSLNYNTFYESEDQGLNHEMESFGFTFWQENTNDLNKPFLKSFNDDKKTNSKKAQDSFGINTPDHPSIEMFRPKEHSTPQQSSKSLSPISKMSSSSSRIDKYCKPLSNLMRETKVTSFSLSQPMTVCNLSSQLNGQQSQEQQIQKTKKCLQQMNQVDDDNQKLKLSNIDLPNDDPFVKVQKWQASLPSINLLVTYSSSECDISEMNFKNMSSNIEIKNGTITHQECKEEKENKVIQSLTQELVTKCRISEKKDCLTNKFTCQKIENKRENRSEEVSHFNTNEKPLVKDMESIFVNNSIYNKSSLSIGFQKNFKDHTQPTSQDLFKCQKSNIPNIIDVSDSSVSEIESCSYFPKSSSVSQTLNKIDKGDFDNNDDSSSMSSSVLESMSSLSALSHNKAPKRKNIIDMYAMNKVPKLGSNTDFILREPKLNITLSVESSSRTTKSKISPDSPGNYEKWFKYRNSNANESMNSYFKTESSQKKAWRARNNANFFVCKDFYFEKSTSLHNCISIMEGMVQEGSSIIESALDRCY